MSEFFLRTEDIKPEEIGDYFVESDLDRSVINALKNRNPMILVGSRGVGKSLLLRVAQKELLNEFDENKAFPIYLSFVRSSLLASDDPEKFKHWMLARICSTVIRALMKAGRFSPLPNAASLLAGTHDISAAEPTRIEGIVSAYENSWRDPKTEIDVSQIPSVDELKEALEDLASELGIGRFALLIDEAAHIFAPEQQRQFFSLFRDLRSHCITCNAAVYPGVTSYGDSFQPTHDATMLSIDRDVTSSDYVDRMREIVGKQADSKTMNNIAKNGKNFSILAYAASGNPRQLLKTISSAPDISSTLINEVIREYYRDGLWAEHSSLAEKYPGHREIIDWGRHFLENHVLPQIKQKNDQYLASDKNTSAYFWIHRDAHEVIKEAFRILAYTGVVREEASGIKATRSEVGTRYIVNLGCLFALESVPTATSWEIVKGLTPKRMTEFGANHTSYSSLIDHINEVPDDPGTALDAQLSKSISVLDISEWQRSKLQELELTSVGDVLRATEEKLKEAHYVGDKRARRMRNAAIAAVLEYLSG